MTMMNARNVADLITVVAGEMGLRCHVFVDRDARKQEEVLAVMAPHHEIPVTVDHREAPRQSAEFVEWVRGLLTPPLPPPPFSPDDNF